jgi:hypothetical protein
MHFSQDDDDDVVFDDNDSEEDYTEEEYTRHETDDIDGFLILDDEENEEEERRAMMLAMSDPRFNSFFSRPSQLRNNVVESSDEEGDFDAEFEDGDNEAEEEEEEEEEEIGECTQCHKQSSVSSMLICKKCEAFIHFKCTHLTQLDPNVHEDWFCDQCIYCSVCSETVTSSNHYRCNKCACAIHVKCNKNNNNPYTGDWLCSACNKKQVVPSQQDQHRSPLKKIIFQKVQQTDRITTSSSQEPPDQIPLTILFQYNGRVLHRSNIDILETELNYSNLYKLVHNTLKSHTPYFRLMKIVVPEKDYHGFDMLVDLSPDMLSMLSEYNNNLLCIVGNNVSII